MNTTQFEQLLDACQQARIELIDQVSAMDDGDPMGARANQVIEVCEAAIANSCSARNDRHNDHMDDMLGPMNDSDIDSMIDDMEPIQ